MAVVLALGFQSKRVTIFDNDRGEIELLQREEDGFGLESVSTTSIPHTEPNSTVIITMGKLEDVQGYPFFLFHSTKIL